MEKKFVNDNDGLYKLKSFKEALSEAEWTLKIHEDLWHFFRNNLPNDLWGNFNLTYKLKELDINYVNFSEDNPEMISYSSLSKILNSKIRPAILFLYLPINGIVQKVHITLLNDSFSYHGTPSSEELEFFNQNNFRDVGYSNIEIILPFGDTAEVISNNYFTRTRCKPGKLFKLLFPDLDSKTIDHYVSLYKSHSLRTFNPESVYTFKLVDQDDIAAYYNDRKYESKSGTLGDSCMRYSHCEDYLKLYTRNPQCKLAILVDKSTDLIAARALVWDDKYYDRIYFSSEKIRLLMKANLERQGYVGIHHGKTYITTSLKNSNSVVINLDESNFHKFPFMDSLFLLNTDTNQLSNCVEINPNKVLGFTDGRTDLTLDNYHISHDNELSYLIGHEEQEDEPCCEACGSCRDVSFIDHYGGELCSDCYNTCEYTDISDIDHRFVRTYEDRYCHADHFVRLIDGGYAYEKDENIAPLSSCYGVRKYALCEDCAIPEGWSTYFMLEDLKYDEENDVYYTEEDWKELQEKLKEEECPECSETSVIIESIQEVQEVQATEVSIEDPTPPVLF